MIRDYDKYKISRSQSEDARNDGKVSYTLLHLHKHVCLKLEVKRGKSREVF